EKAARTACPSPGDWAAAFAGAKHCVALTISGALSGSLHSAQSGRTLALEEDPEASVIVLNTRSTGPGMVLCIEKLREWIAAGHSIEAIEVEANALIDRMHTVFALSSFNNLVKNGRMNRIVGFIAHKLGMWGIGIGDKKGEIAIRGTTRGAAGVVSKIIEELELCGYQGGELAISHCMNHPMAVRLRDVIHGHWADAPISIRPTRGLDSFYAERGGLIVAFLT
nr:DegV family protein [Oscillospiraceae bacterium]